MWSGEGFFGETDAGWSNQVELTLALIVKMSLSEIVDSERHSHFHWN